MEPPGTDFLSGVRCARAGRAAGAGRGGGERGLTLSQYGLLEGLTTRPSARVQELAGNAGVTPSTATRILDALERRGIVESGALARGSPRGGGEPHRPGRQLLRHEQGGCADGSESFYASLPAAEQELAPDLLLRLAALIDELASGRGQPDRLLTKRLHFGHAGATSVARRLHISRAS